MFEGVARQAQMTRTKSTRPLAALQTGDAERGRATARTGATVVPLFRPDSGSRLDPFLRAEGAAAPGAPAAPLRARGALLATAVLSLLLHGMAFAAIFGWNEGPQVSAGTAMTVEVVSAAALGSRAGGETIDTIPEGTEAASAAAAPAPAPAPPQRAETPAAPPEVRQAALPEPAPAPVPESTPEPTPIREPVQAREPAAPIEERPPQTAEPEAPTESRSEGAEEVAALPDKAQPPLPAVKPEPPVAQQTANLPPAGPTTEDAAPNAESGQGESASPANAVPAEQASPSEGTASAGGGVTRGAAPAAGNAPPDYPMSARRRGQEGLVLLDVVLTPGGRPERIDLAKSSGWRSLDRAALEAVERWRFEPAMENGLPVASLLRLPVRFRLED